MRVFILVPFLLAACGARVLDDSGKNGAGVDGTEKAEVTDAAAAVVDSSAPPSMPTSSPTVEPAPAPDAAKPAPVVDASVVTCTDGPATGSPTGCGPDKACNAGDVVTEEWARDLLSCYVDRCSMAATGKPWCGTIGLKFGPDGCTMDYVESGPGAGGCVKYQGYYRAWPCLAGKNITVTRPCP